MKKVCLLIVPLFLFFMVGCASPTGGFLFTGTTEHIYGSAHGTTLTGGGITKKGESCSHSIILLNYFYYGGGASIKDAMKGANITKVGVVDHSSFTFLWFYWQHCVIVYGE